MNEKDEWDDVIGTHDEDMIRACNGAMSQIYNRLAWDKRFRKVDAPTATVAGGIDAIIVSMRFPVTRRCNHGESSEEALDGFHRAGVGDD